MDDLIEEMESRGWRRDFDRINKTEQCWRPRELAPRAGLRDCELNRKPPAIVLTRHRIHDRGWVGYELELFGERSGLAYALKAYATIRTADDVERAAVALARAWEALP